MITALDNNDVRIAASPDSTARCPQCKNLVGSKCGSIKAWHWAHKNCQDCDSWSEPETIWHLDWKKHFPLEQTEVVIKKQDVVHRADAISRTGVIIEFQNSPISSKDIGLREKFYERMIWILNGNDFDSNFKFSDKNTSISKLSLENIFWRSPLDQEYIAIKLTDFEVSNKDILLTILSDSKYEYLPMYDAYHYKPIIALPFHYYDNGLLYPLKHNWESHLPNDLSKELSKSILEVEVIKKQGEEDLEFHWKNPRKIWTSAKMPLFVDFNNGYLLYIKTLYEYGLGFGRFIKKETFLKKYAS